MPSLPQRERLRSVSTDALVALAVHYEREFDGFVTRLQPFPAGEPRRLFRFPLPIVAGRRRPRQLTQGAYGPAARLPGEEYASCMTRQRTGRRCTPMRK